jgi:hypothetical protein
VAYGPPLTFLAMSGVADTAHSTSQDDVEQYHASAAFISVARVQFNGFFYVR